MNLSIIDRLLLLLLAASAVQAGPHPQLRADLALGKLCSEKKLMKYLKWITFSGADNTKEFCDMSYDDIDARAAGLLAQKFGKLIMIFNIIQPRY